MSNILITGTSSGIGLGSAVELARRGERVFASMRNLDRSGPLLEAAQAAGVGLELLQLDVTDQGSVERAVKEVVDLAGSIDVVVNNAGIVVGGPLEFSTDEEAWRIFDTNVLGPLRVIRAVLPHMRAQGSGRIINISSGAADPRVGARLIALYGASKAALSSLTLELVKEVAPLGIDVILMERGVGGATSMIEGIRDEIARRSMAGSPYRLAEEILRREFPAEFPDPATSVGLVADACLMTDPPVRYPAGLHEQRDAESASISDEQYKKLARFDTDPEILEGVQGFWLIQKALLAQATGTT